MTITTELHPELSPDLAPPVATITINAPDNENRLNPDSLRNLGAVIDELCEATDI